MEGERDGDLEFHVHEKVPSWAWVEALDADMQTWIQSFGDGGHVMVDQLVVPPAMEMVAPPAMDTVVAVVDEVVPAVNSEEKEEAQGVMREGEGAVLVVQAEQAELDHGEGAQVVAAVHAAAAENAKENYESKYNKS
jgi:hypothetical protein